MEFGTAVLPRRFIAVRSNRDCASRSGLATTASTAMVLVGKKSITAVRGSSRDQSASSGDRRAWTALLLADMGSRVMRGTARPHRCRFCPHGYGGLCACEGEL